MEVIAFQAVRNVPKNSYISGPDLCKYYSRPVDIKSKPNDIVHIEYESEIEEPVASPVSSVKENVVTTSFVSKGTQTDYRESESQTDPWDPPFVVRSSFNEPEVLLLKEFSYGNGLPVTQTEVDHILKIRENKELYAPSEGFATYEEFRRNKQVICNQIQNEWNYKISKRSEQLLDKLKQMETALSQELIMKSERQERLLKNMWTQKKEQMAKMNAKLQRELKKELKGLERKSRYGIQKFDAKAYGMNTTAKELAMHINNNKESLNQDIDNLISKYHMNPNGLSKLSNWLERKRTNLYNEIPLAKPAHKDKREKLTEKAYQDLVEKKRLKMPPKIYHEDYDEEEAAAEESALKGEVEFEILELPEEGVDLVTVWQQVLRGRAYQKQMLELIEKHKDTLDVLLSSQILRKI